ncbi:transcriptional repressor [Alteromonas oceanisediminis]|uniref:transcriptional repressor n=1 Tax=Alteromonas oceanisediminis TaxID=2836180 RepID=UPI001BDB47AB|nr:transcriptional repressor [Alteromonas oceanisediminis]MBT0585956.1 transcriptional repressor [Alteromonas oceanisediminis]
MTQQRKKMLGVLSCCAKPFSAYEITELYNNTFDDQLIANSVYRILHDLVEVRLVYRLNTVNKYFVCKTADQLSKDTFLLFTICSQCLHIDAEPAPTEMVSLAENKVAKNNFNHVVSQIELIGMCSQCHTPSNYSEEHYA